MRENAHRRSRRTLTLAVTAAVVLAGGAVGAWAGGLVRSADRPAAVAKPAKKAAPIWVAGAAKNVVAVHAAAKPVVRHSATKPVAAKPRHKAKPATHVARKLATSPPPVDLCAKAGSVSLGGVDVPIWGFALLGTAPSCDDPSVVPSLPGPQLDVNAGDTLTVNITNAIAGETISIETPGATLGGDTDAATGETISLTLSGGEGTYIYESSGDAGRQTAMGLYGAFVVHSGTPGTADGVAVDAEQTLVLSEVDTNFNADPLGFDMNNWHPQWWLVNGKSYPGTDTIDVTAGERVLLRWANAGSDNHTMSTLGLHQRLLARDGSLLPAPVDAVSETFPSGGTADGVVTVPAGAARGDRFPVYNRNMDLGQTFFLRLPTED